MNKRPELSVKRCKAFFRKREENFMQQIDRLTRANANACNLRTDDLTEIGTLKRKLELADMEIARVSQMFVKQSQILSKYKEYYEGDGLCPKCHIPLMLYLRLTHD